jgi:hypothetical protein
MLDEYGNMSLIEIYPESTKKSSSKEEITEPIASAPVVPIHIVPKIGIALKFNIIKDGSSEVDYESVDLDDLITQHELKKLKKEYNYKYTTELDSINKSIFSELELKHINIPNSENTEKCIGYLEYSGKLTELRFEKMNFIDYILNTFLDFINSITFIIHNKVQRRLNIHLNVVKILGSDITREFLYNNTKIMVFNESLLLNIRTPNEADLRKTIEISTKNSWTLYINSHSDFFFYYPEDFSETDEAIPNISDNNIHLLYYGKLGLMNLHRFEYDKFIDETNFLFPIIQYLYKIKNYQLTESSVLNQLIIENKDKFITIYTELQTKNDANILLHTEQISANTDIIQKEEDKIAALKLTTESNVTMQISKSQFIISNTLELNTKLEENIDKFKSYNKICILYLDNLLHDVPFFNIITLGSNKRLTKNNKIVILKTFYFDDAFNYFKIMNVKSTNPVLNGLNELDLRHDDDKIILLDILLQITGDPLIIENISIMLNRNNITMYEIANIGRLLGLTETNIITSGCNTYRPHSRELSPSQILYIHDDPNGLAFGIHNKKTQLNHITRRQKKINLKQKTKGKKLKQRSKQYNLKQISRQKLRQKLRLKQKSKKITR